MASLLVRTMDQVDGWQTLANRPKGQPMNLTICPNALLKRNCRALA